VGLPNKTYMVFGYVSGSLNPSYVLVFRHN